MRVLGWDLAMLLLQMANRLMPETLLEASLCVVSRGLWRCLGAAEPTERFVSDDRPRVSVGDATFVGTKNGTLNQWAGIFYAEHPVGQRRFAGRAAPLSFGGGISCALFFLFLSP